MLESRTFLVALLIWLAALGTVPVLPELGPSSTSTTRPEPIEVEPDTLTVGPGPAGRG